MIKTKLILAKSGPNGQLIEQKEQESRSFIKPLLQLLYVHHAAVSTGSPYPMLDITNTSRNMDDTFGGTGDIRKSTLMVGSPPGICGVWVSGGALNYTAGFLDGSKIGIQVGTGNNPVTPTDIALQSRIAHGEGAGQLLYGGCELFGLTLSNPNGQFTVRRYFTNVLGGSISIQEAGIYAVGASNTQGGEGSWYFCIARDVFSAVTVNNGEILRVTYMVQITV
jgi:hypothetical protein